MAVANPYLRDNYGPVCTEETVTDLPVTGTLPDSLHGRYLRNGPNPIGSPDPATYHWFTGEGMVHGIRLGDGAARLVPEPLGPLGGRGGCARGAGPSRAGGRGDGLRAQHQRDRATRNAPTRSSRPARAPTS